MTNGALVVESMAMRADGGKNTAGQACDGSRNMYLSLSYTRLGVGLGTDSTNGLSYWYITPVLST